MIIVIIIFRLETAITIKFNDISQQPKKWNKMQVVRPICRILPGMTQ